MVLPQDDFILLSLVNTKLRDLYSSLAELCEEEDIDLNEVSSRLAAIGYEYDGTENAFRRA